jgi:hypothetical protein
MALREKAGQKSDDSFPKSSLGWLPNEAGDKIIWAGDRGYSQVDWLKCIIFAVLEPRGYVLNGVADWFGQGGRGKYDVLNYTDDGRITVIDNMVHVTTTSSPCDVQE